MATLASLTAQTDYRTLIEEAQREAAKYDTYNTALGEIEKLIPRWQEQHTSIDEGTCIPPPTADIVSTELKDKTTRYLAFRDVRDEIPQTLKVCNGAISKCFPDGENPPFLDLTTVSALQKMRLIDVEAVKREYRVLFGGVETVEEQEGSKTTKIAGLAEELKSQRDRIQALYERMIPALQTLRKTLEPLAHAEKRLLDSSGWGVGSLLMSALTVGQRWGGATPDANAAIERRKTELARQARQAAAQPGV